MRVLTIATVLLAAFPSVDAGKNIRIINGTEVPEGKSKYTVLFTIDDDTGYYTCSGALVAPKTIVTTAWCASGKPTEAVIGSRYFNGTGGESIRVANITLHPQFNASTLDYNIAVVELATPSAIAPIKVSLDNGNSVKPNKTAWVRGWGISQADDNVPSPVLLEADVFFYSLETCQEIYSKWVLKPTERTICAGGQGKEICYGDMAAPLTVVKGDAEELVGLSSWMYKCKTGYPAGYALLSSVSEFLKPYLPIPAC